MWPTIDILARTYSGLSTASITTTAKNENSFRREFSAIDHVIPDAFCTPRLISIWTLL